MDNMCMAILFLLFGISSVVTGNTTAKRSRDISKYLLLKNYWSEKLSKADNGYLILTTKYKIPNNLNVSQHKPDELIQGGIVPVDCSAIHKHWPTAPNGVYKIYPAGGMGHTVYCDMKTDGGGWTIFQRRFDGSENFYRSWSDYRQGFGHVTGEHWLGNQILHEITVHGLYEMRIDLSDFDGNKKFAKYSTFSIANEAAGYRIQFSGYTGTAGDSMSMANGMKFATYDKDLDRARYNCAESTNGAWWFKNCFYAHLNGKYQKTARTDDWRGLIWYTWHGKSYSLKQTSMMLRKHQKKGTK